MKREVYIAVPTTDRKVDAALAHTLCEAERRSADSDCPWAFSKAFYLSYKPVDYMRNAIFGDFLASDAELLWMLDADVIPPPHAFDMLDVDADIVAGVIPGMKTGVNGGLVIRCLAFDMRDGQLESIDPMTHSPEVDAAGAGAMLIRRHVLEDTRMRLSEDPPEGTRPSNWAPAIYMVRYEPWGALKMTGDVDFCMRAKELGYTLRLWPSEMFGQTETLDLREVAAYGARCAADAAKRATA